MNSVSAKVQRCNGKRENNSINKTAEGNFFVYESSKVMLSHLIGKKSRLIRSIVIIILLLYIPIHYCQIGKFPM